MWNRAVSERLRQYGREVLVGDMVVPKGTEEIEEIVDEEALAVDDNAE